MPEPTAAGTERSASVPAAGSFGLPPSVQSSTPARTAYLPQLDGLRALAIVLVFLHHAYSIPLLWSGVDLFFILSGYLITNILLRDSGRMRFGSMLKHFYLRRAQRILPAYVLSLLLIALFSVQDWHRLWPYFALFLQNVPYAFHLIGFGPLVPLWSLAVEQHFYLVWPFVVFYLPRRWLPWSLLALLLGVPLLRGWCTPLFTTPEAIYSLTPFRVDTMAAGALAAVWLPRFRVESTRRLALLLTFLGLFLYAVLAMHPWFRRNSNTSIFNALGYSLNIAILGGIFVLTVVASPTKVWAKLLSSSPLRFLGRISYTFYLLHLLVLVRLGGVLPPRWGPPIAFVLTAGVAWASWRLLEAPILRLGGARRGASMQPRSA